MDKQLLEFWGNTLINMAKNQEQMETMTRWMNQGTKLGLSGLESWTDLFGRFWDTAPKAAKKEPGDGDTNPFQAPTWIRPMEDLQASINWFCDFMGFVPKQEHLEIVQKYEALKQRMADLEETVRHLRLVQREGNVDQGTVVNDFRRMIEQQTEQFQELMKNTEKFFNYTVSPSKPPEQA